MRAVVTNVSKRNKVSMNYAYTKNEAQQLKLRFSAKLLIF